AANELTSRGVWNDVLLLATIPPTQDRQSIANALQYIYQPIPGLGNTSVYNVFMNSVQKVSPVDFYHFVSSLNTYVDSDRPIFQPLLQSLRDLYYINDVHPVSDTLRTILENASDDNGI